MNNEIKVLLVDDHAIMRKGLVMLLSEEADITIVGEAEDGEQAIERVRTLQPDVVVMDISMPKLNGIEATRQIVSESPGTRVIALSIQSSRRFVDDMLKAGAAGYLLKESVPEELIQSIRAVMQDEKFLSSAITGTVLSAYLEQISEDSAENESATDVAILKSKLYPPTITADIIPRPKLMERLEAGRTRPLTLVSAPAGYGKSTLINNWLEQTDWASVWISLDTDDGDLRQFLSYFLCAVQTVFPDNCKKTMKLIKAPQLPPLSALVSSLTNELEELDQPLILVLDDYQRIDVHSAVNELLQTLLQYPPIPLHLVITTRRDPALSLVTLRSKAQVNEIRMQELRFDPMEVQALLESTAGITVSNDALNNLDKELEGWAVGLRLASLVVSQSKDPEGFLKHLHGGLQHTQEYMVQEVIAGLPQILRDWLLKTAILDRFCAPLCDAICQQEAAIETLDFDGNKFIKAVLHDNLFVIQLGSKSEWMRYHHLFQELLLRELSKLLVPSEIAELHKRASSWFETNNMFDEAIKHALQAQDVEAAANIVERQRNKLLDQDKWYVLETWLKKLPVKTIQQRPVLMLTRAYIAFFNQRFEEIDSIVNQFESSFCNDPKNNSLKEKDYCLELRFFRGYLYFGQGNTKDSQCEFEAVIEGVPAEPQVLIGETELHLNIVRAMRGNSILAIEAINHRLTNIGVTSGPLLARLVGTLAILYLLTGDLQLLRFEARRMPELAKPNRSVYSDAWGYYLEGISDLHTMDLDSALNHLSVPCDSPYTTDARAAIDAMAGIALIQQLMGRTELAQVTLKRLVQFACETNDPVQISVARSCEARIALLQGNTAQAFHWADQFNDEVDPYGLFFWLETPHITQARILILHGSPQSLSRAGDLLGKIKEITESYHFICHDHRSRCIRVTVTGKTGQQ